MRFQKILFSVLLVGCTVWGGARIGFTQQLSTTYQLMTKSAKGMKQVRSNSDGGINPTGRPDSGSSSTGLQQISGESRISRKAWGGKSGFSGEANQGLYYPIATSEHVDISVSPATQSVTAGQNVTYQATLNVTDDTSSALLVCLAADLPFTCSSNGHTIYAGQTKTLTVKTTTQTPPGTYTVDVMGLTIKNEYTEKTQITVTVNAPPPPPTTTNAAHIEIDSSGAESTLLSGGYDLDGTSAIAAFVDDEGNGIIDRESGSDFHVYPRIPVQSGTTWALQAGRRYESNANLVLLARFSTWSTATPQFLALHFGVQGGQITPVAMLAGDLTDVVTLPYSGTAKGVVMGSTSPFTFEGSGVMPTATVNGVLSGTASGNVFFTSPEGFIYGSTISINFDITVFND